MSKLKTQILFAALAVAGVCPLTSSAYTSSYYAANSKLSQGKWVKIRVNKTGMQQITAAELKAMGFSNPESVAVYGYGNSALSSQRYDAGLTDDIAPVATSVINGKLVFFGEADALPQVKLRREGTSYVKGVDPNRNYYADFGCYFLTDSKKAEEVKTVPFAAPAQDNANTLDYCYGIVDWDVDTTHPGAEGAFLFDKDFSSERINDLEFSMPRLNENCPEDNMVSVAGYIGIGTNDLFTDFTISMGQGKSSLKVNQGQEIDDAYKISSFSFNAPAEKAANDLYTLHSDLSKLTSCWFAGIESFRVVYPRTTDFTGLAQDRVFYLNLSSGAQEDVVSLTASPTARVWDVTVSDKPVELQLSDKGNGNFEFTPQRNYALTANQSAPSYVVFDPSEELYSVESLGVVGNQNLHALQTPRMLIITTPLLRQQAEELAAIHRSYNGIDVLVVEPEEVYNEFSSGTPNIMGLRRFIRMFYDRDPKKFNSVLLFGPSLADNRFITYAGENPRDKYLPVFSTPVREYSGSKIQAYASDATFGMMNDNFSTELEKHINQPMQVAVGRIPAQNFSEAEIYIAKVRDYLSNPFSNPKKTALLIADTGDKAGHQENSEDLASRILSVSPATTIVRAYHNLYPKSEMVRETISSYLKDNNIGFYSYSGHSDGKDLGSGYIWGYRANQATSTSRYPFVMLSTCHTMPIDMGSDCLGHELTFKRDGGTTALVAAGRAVYMKSNQIINLTIGEAFFAAKETATTGDIYRAGRNQAIKNSAGNSSTLSREQKINLINTNCFNFIGDPELPAYAPGLEANITTVGGEPLTYQTVNIDPYVSTPITGTITDRSGETVTSFNGKAVISVFDSPRKVKTLFHNAETNPSTELTLDETLLAEFEVVVVNGEFKADLAVAPGAFANGQQNRITVSAIEPESGERAFGMTTGIVFNAYDPENAPENLPSPQITEMYIDNPDSGNGAVVTGDCTLYAVIYSEGAPLITSTTGLGSGFSLILDDKQSLEGLSSCVKLNDDGTSSFVYPLKDLTPGVHTITLRVENTLGMKTFRSLSFSVTDEPSASFLIVEKGPATDEVQIDLSHNLGSVPEARLVIYDAQGNAVRSIDNASFPYIWDLKDAEGNRVAPGLYHPRAYLKGIGETSVSKKANIVVGKSN